MGEWDELYRENILDHYKHPRNRGTLEHPDITYEDANPLCGDQLRIDIAREGREDRADPPLGPRLLDQPGRGLDAVRARWRASRSRRSSS